MELDKRIEALTDILSVTVGCHDWELMTKKGYFANSIFDFKDLKRLCVYGEYAGWREHNQCFLCKQAGDETYYSYFIPEDSLLPEEKPEKKYRPYTKHEFLNKFECGKPINIRRKDDYINFFIETMPSVKIDNLSDDVHVRLFEGIFNLKRLFDEFEWQKSNGEWQPFGMIDEDKE